MRLVTINDVEYTFLLQTLTKVFIFRILINFYNINLINFLFAKQSSEVVASLPQWKLRHCVDYFCLFLLTCVCVL
jgi:hypothetical protein